MADVSKSVAIIFSSDTASATTAVESLNKEIGKLGDPVPDSGLGTTIADLGTSSSTTKVATEGLRSSLTKLAEDAGVPKAALTGLDDVLAKIGKPAIGTVATAALAIVAIGAAMFKTGTEASDFKIALSNISGGALDADEALGFVTDTALKLGTNSKDTGDAYVKFLTQVSGTGVAAKTANDAFAGILAAIDGIDGDMPDAERALTAFIKVADDGEIDLGDLQKIMLAIPGGLRILADAVGVPETELRALADAGKLGKDEIEKFATALNNQTYKDISPVSDGFNNLFTALKGLALELGAETGANALLTLLATALEGLTTGVTLAKDGISALKDLFSGFSTSASDAKDDINLFSGDVEKYQTAVSGAKVETKLFLDDIVSWDQVVTDANAETKLFGTTITDVATAQTTANAAIDKASTSSKEAAAELKKQADEAKRVEENAKAMALELEKLASNERIAAMEFRAEINVAQIQADAEKVKAAFESIGTTITSTGDVLSSLFSQFSQFDSLSFGAQRVVLDQIDAENKLRRDAFELQKKLTDAQIAAMEATTRSLEGGSALIEIDGKGLQPQLEAFMWEILKSVQTRVNRDGLSLLLGV